MKKKFLVLIIMIGIVLTGCVKMDVNLTINKDGSLDSNLTFGLENDVYSLVQATNQNPFTELREELVSKDFQIEEYQDDQYIGFKASSHFKSVEDFNENFEEFPVKIETKDDLFCTTYYINGAFIMDKTEYGSFGQIMLSDRMDLYFTLTLPGKIGENNATNSQENTLSWKINPYENNEIYAEAKFTKTINLVITGMLSFFILITMIRFVLKVKKR